MYRMTEYYYRKCTKIVMLFVSCLILNKAQAMVVHDPANFFQNRITAMNSIKSLIEQIKSVNYQLNMYKNDLKNMRVLKSSVWIDTHQQLQKIIHQQMQGNVPSYFSTDPSKSFQEKFAYSKNGEDLYRNEKNMSAVVFNVAKNSFASAGLHIKGLDEEEHINKKLQLLSAQSQGQMEALQTANLFSGMQISQLQKLRELLINQINVQANNIAFQVSREQARNAAVTQWLQSSKKNIPNYGSSKGFGPESIALS